MSFVVDEAVEKYAEEHSTPAAELFTRLAAETRESQTAPQMMVGQLEGAFLSFVVYLAKPKLVLELGTFTGWSSIAMAGALPPGGKIITCDINEETNAIARRYAEEAGVADRIEYVLGPGVESIAKLDGPFDLIFIDADKPGYIDYYEAALPKLADGGVIMADNTLSSGRVLDPVGNEMAEAITRFNDHVRADARVECVMLTVRDGIMLIRRRAQQSAR
jgi:caffeoyl-CoA O-methyltransferase